MAYEKKMAITMERRQRFKKWRGDTDETRLRKFVCLAKMEQLIKQIRMDVENPNKRRVFELNEFGDAYDECSFEDKEAGVMIQMSIERKEDKKEKEDEEDVVEWKEKDGKKKEDEKEE